MKRNLQKSIMKTMGCMFLCLLFFANANQVQAGVTSIYPFPATMAAGVNYNVWVDGQPVNIWRADANADIANFAYSGSVTVRVRLKNNANFNTAILTPGIFGITVNKTAANEVTFVLSNPQQSRVVLRIDNDPQKDLFIWGDPPVVPAPSGAVMYGAGSHYFADDLLTLASNTTYYLAPGSVLHAQVVIPAGATNVKVLGRGIIVAAYRGRYEHCFTIQDFCSFIEINGVTLTNNNFPDKTDADEYLDLHQLVIRGYDAHHITVDNFKIIGEYYTSDGISLSGCNNVTVQDCFVVSADNAFSIGWEGNTGDCQILRTVLHQTRGIYTSAIFPQGYYEPETGSELTNLTIKDLWISQTMGTIIGCNFGNSFEKVTNFLVENVHVDRIYLYDDIDGDGDPDYNWAVADGFNKFISMELAPKQGGQVTLRNVHWVEDKDYEGELTAGWTVTYDKVYYDGRLVTTVENAKLGLNDGILIIQNTVAPTVSTTTPSSITSTMASSGGNVSASGGTTVTARGVCWSTSSNPTTANNKTSNGTGTGTFTSSITGLTANTTYNVRAYATNSSGTRYGSNQQFTTASAGGGTWNKIENTATGWTNSGAGTWTDAANSGGSTWTISNSGSYVEYTFTGTQVQVYSKKDGDMTNGNIYIDNVLVGSNISWNQGTQAYQQLVWQSGTLSNASHTIKIVTTGDYIEVDYLRVSTSSSASLTGSVAINTTAVNLTTVGTSDWKHFRNNNHKASGSMINSISNYTTIGGIGSFYNNDLRNMSWTGGTPTATGTNNKNGVFIGGVNNGFSFTAPACNGVNVLKVYVGGYNSTGRLTAHLSNSAAADYVNASPTGTGQYDAVYTITYNAAQAGQTITISWVQTAGAGNVTIQGAALAGSGGAMAVRSEQPAAANVAVTLQPEVSSLSAIGFYPNPTTDVVTIDFKTNLNSEEAEVELTDLMGRKVYSSGISQVSTLQINTSAYPKGNYVLSIRRGTEKVNKILIIE